MRSKLLEADRLSELSDSHSLPELFRRTHPGRTFEGHLQFESEIVRDEILQLNRILEHLSGDFFPLFQWLLTAFQLENLKVALRSHMAHEKRAATEALLAPTPRWLSLPTEKLFDAPDLARFVRAVPQPALQAALQAVLNETSKPDLFTLDMALDSAYIKRLVELAGRTDRWTRRLVGFDVDRRSLLLLLRARFNYRCAFDQIEPFFSPAGEFLTTQSALRIFDAPDIKEAIHRIPNGGVPDALRDGVASLTRLEDLLFLQHYRLAARCYVESVLGMASVVAFYYIKTIETTNLIRLTELVRHSLPREEIDSSLLKLAR